MLKAMITITDLMTTLVDTVFVARIRKGMLRIIISKDGSMPVCELIRMAIPVTPPSRNPFGSKNALRPILASVAARNI